MYCPATTVYRFPLGGKIAVTIRNPSWRARVLKPLYTAVFSSVCAARVQIRRMQRRISLSIDIQISSLMHYSKSRTAI